MTTSQTPFFSEIAAGHSGPPIPASKRAYFQARLKNRLFDYILGKFVAQQKNGLTKAALARRIGKSPEVVNRLLGAPSNLTLDTVSDLLIGIAGEELTPASEGVLNQSSRQNFWHGDDWIQRDDQSKPQPPSPRGLEGAVGGSPNQTDRGSPGRGLKAA